MAGLYDDVKECAADVTEQIITEMAEFGIEGEIKASSSNDAMTNSKGAFEFGYRDFSVDTTLTNMAGEVLVGVSVTGIVNTEGTSGAFNDSSYFTASQGWLSGDPSFKSFEDIPQGPGANGTPLTGLSALEGAEGSGINVVEDRMQTCITNRAAGLTPFGSQ